VIKDIAAVASCRAMSYHIGGRVHCRPGIACGKIPVMRLTEHAGRPERPARNAEMVALTAVRYRSHPRRTVLTVTLRGDGVMKRRGFVRTLTAVLLAPHAVNAQTPRRVMPRVGFLSVIPLTDPQLTPYLAAFREGLREVGLVEGESLTIEYRSANGKYEWLSDLAAELVRLKVDVIVASGGTPVVRAAQRATSTTPIVMTSIGDPVAAGLVASLARPGGNVTGLAIIVSELVGKRLELLMDLVPGMSRIGVLWNPVNPSSELREADAAARPFGFRVLPVMAASPQAIDEAFSAFIEERIDALFVVADSMLIAQRERIAALAAKNRLPAVYANRLHVEAGGLLSYGANLLDVSRRLAAYVDKILKGANPAELPVERPTKFELIVNTKAARALGLSVPASLLLRADQVIE